MRSCAFEENYNKCKRQEATDHRDYGTKNQDNISSTFFVISIITKIVKII